MKTKSQPESQTPQNNARRHLRVPLIVENVACDDGRKTFFGYARNISCGGLFIGTVSPREPGDQFSLQLTLPGAIPVTLQCRCEVVWKRHFSLGRKYEPGMGLRFLDLDESSRAVLKHWLQSHGGTKPT